MDLKSIRRSAVLHLQELEEEYDKLTMKQFEIEHEKIKLFDKIVDANKAVEDLDERIEAEESDYEGDY